MNKRQTDMFLIGGGWNTEAFKLTYGPFINASTSSTGRKIALVIALEDDSDAQELEADYRNPFERLMVRPEEIKTIFLSQNRPLTKEMLNSAKPTGVFVCGGNTPLYHETLSKNIDWLDYLVEKQIPYGGFSAGSAVVSDQAVLGGWKLSSGNTQIPIIDEEVGEGLDQLTIRDGLGLLSVSIDVHCGQWGTITRLINAVNNNLIKYGLGIDENTMLQVRNDSLIVFGSGQIYLIKKDKISGITVEIFKHGDSITL